MGKYFVIPANQGIWTPQAIANCMYSTEETCETHEEAVQQARNLCRQYNCSFIIGVQEKLIELKYDATVL